MIYRHGCPRRILCDQGKLFVEQLNGWMCNALGIERNLITAYDSQINGLDERTNDNIKRVIRKLVQKKENQWDADLEATLFSIRSKIQTTTKYSPFLLMYGREAVFPSEVPVDLPLLSTIVLPDEDTYSKFLEEREVSMKKIKEATIINIVKGQIKHKMNNEKRMLLKRQKVSSSAGNEYTTFPLSSHDIPGSPHSVHILMEGYCKDMSNDRFQADGSVTLIRGPLTVLVDTAGPWSRDFLICSLQIHGVSPEDVTHVICTHGHSDHVGNLNLFTKAEILVSYDLWRDGSYVSHDFRSGEPYLLPGGEGLKVVPTPGHTGSDVTLLVPGTSLGIVAITGDLFEREGDEDTWRNLSENPEIQEKSRRNILGFADVIVPGHGPPFRVIRNGQEPEAT
ncbi:metallo-beta-lactamase domain-containing protein 1-like isoform X1 [Hyla sarda]|uniref:metallo-beta-lactamase domain-containing protein 1-like isoform X1 n=1 Tax=Hyla sarda TaxID=327740 RepID=UPI0024C281E2|nr:metallo-beta-lactamase domain-containing protein 1-like isoform X1 [Hyla sarda]